jgi:hypothetical protein
MSPRCARALPHHPHTRNAWARLLSQMNFTPRDRVQMIAWALLILTVGILVSILVWAW